MSFPYLNINLNHSIFYIPLLASLVIGLFSVRKIKNIKDYALASKSFSPLVIAMTLIATKIGGGHLNRIGFFSTDGLTIFLLGIGTIVSFLIFGYILGPRIVFFSNCITLGDMINKLYGNIPRIISGSIGFIYCIILTVIQILSLSKICYYFMGINKELALLLGGIVIITYSAIGGIRSVTITDIFQFILLGMFISILGTGIISKIGGVDSMFKIIWANSPHMLKINTVNHHLKIGEMLINSFGFMIISPPFIQRIFMAGNKEKVKKMFLFSIMFYSIFWILVTIIGMGAFTILGSSTKGIDIIPSIIQNLFSKSTQGVLISGVIATIMSTADSFLNSGGISLTHDIIKPICEKRKLKINEVKLTKYSVTFTGILIIFLGYLAEKFSFNIMYLCKWTSLLMSILFTPFIAGLFDLKTDKASFYVPLFSSILVIILCLMLNISHMFHITFWSILTNISSFFIFHIIKYNKIAFAGIVKTNKSILPIQISKKTSFFNKYIHNIKNKIKSKENKFYFDEPNFVPFSIIIILGYMLPFHTIKEHTLDTRLIVIITRLIGLICIALLISKSLWPKKLKKSLFPPLWHFTLTYCLIFSNFLTFLLGASTSKWPAEIMVAMVMMVLLLEKKNFVVLTLIGIFSAFLIAYLKTGSVTLTPPLPKISKAYTLAYGIITYIVVVWIIKSTNEKNYTNFRNSFINKSMGHGIKNYTGQMINYTESIEQTIIQNMKPIIGEENQKGFFLDEHNYKLLKQNLKQIVKIGEDGIQTSSLINEQTFITRKTVGNNKYLKMEVIVKLN